MANPDPIQPVVDALGVVFAQPVGSDAASYKSGTATVPNPGVVSAVSGLLNVMYGASSDFKQTGQSVSDALKSTAGVLSALGDQVLGLGNLADIADAMKRLQQAMALAKALVPGGPAVALDSAGTLFAQIQDLLSAPGQSATNAAIELYKLAQQLRKVADEIGPQ